jgi:hypothetical protein
MAPDESLALMKPSEFVFTAVTRLSSRRSRRHRRDGKSFYEATPEFLPARSITQPDLAALTKRVHRRVIRWFRLRRLLAARRPTGATWCRCTMSVPETAFGNRETGIRGSRAAHHLKNAEDVPLTALTSAGTPSVPRSLGRPGR